jgi:hypothetical protein
MDQLFPTFIQAKTVEDLRSLMMKVSFSRGGTVNFFSVYYDTVSKSHVAWYHDKAENIAAQQYNAVKVPNAVRQSN